MTTFTFTRTSPTFTLLQATYVSLLTQECMIGLCYADEAGAAQLYKKLNNRAKYGTSPLSPSEIILELVRIWLREKAHQQTRLVQELQLGRKARCKDQHTDTAGPR